jgi:hypothetical protein
MEKEYLATWTSNCSEYMQGCDESIAMFLMKAINFHAIDKENELFVFKRIGNMKTILRNGNREQLDEFPSSLPYESELWVKIDDYGKHFQVTAMLPSDY